jgi:hypothetical protein
VVVFRLCCSVSQIVEETVFENSPRSVWRSTRRTRNERGFVCCAATVSRRLHASSTTHSNAASQSALGRPDVLCEAARRAQVASNRRRSAHTVSRTERVARRRSLATHDENSLCQGGTWYARLLYCVLFVCSFVCCSKRERHNC